MAGGLALMVDERMVMQGFIFLCALWIIKYFYVSPLVKLYLERQRRTQGNLVEAEAILKLAAQSKEYYNQEINVTVEEARNLRTNYISEGNSAGKEIIQKAQEESLRKVRESAIEIEKSLNTHSKALELMADDFSNKILHNLNILPIICMFLFITNAQGAESKLDITYSVVWPIFQFGVFIAFGWFLGSKVLTNKLQDRRDNLRLKISEAHEAIQTAKEQAMLYESKLKELEIEKNNIKKGYTDDGIKERLKIISDAQDAASFIILNAEKQVEEMIKKNKQQIADKFIETAFQKVEKQLNSMDLSHYNSSLLNDTLSKSSEIKNLL